MSQGVRLIGPALDKICNILYNFMVLCMVFLKGSI